MSVVNIICLKLKDLSTPYTQSCVEHCSNCTSYVWASVTTLMLRSENPKIRLICTDCSRKHEGDISFANPTPAQNEEIERMLGRPLLQAEIDRIKELAKKVYT